MVIIDILKVSIVIASFLLHDDVADAAMAVSLLLLPHYTPVNSPPLSLLPFIMSQYPARRQISGQSVPEAPYPPSPPTQQIAANSSRDEASQIRSALSTTPHFPSQQQQYTSTSFRREQDARSAKLRQYSQTISRALFCPSQSDVYACINCVSDNATSGTAQQKERGSNKRMGPVLLELRRLKLHENSDENRHHHGLLDSTTLATSQGNPSLGTSVASTCMAYPNTLEETPIVQEYTPCATGLSTGALAIHSFSSGQEQGVSSNITYFATRHQRQASAVAWRPRNASQVAIGLISSSGGTFGSSSHHHRPRGGRAASGDREFCCLLWDVTKGTTTAPISKLSHNVGVASLAWLSEGKTLCVGSQLRHFHLYDLRISGTTATPTSTWAHTDAVNGIEVDPKRSDILATFGRTAGEPVKLWDVRRMDTSIGEIKTTGGQTVSAIHWSYKFPGTLSVALGDSIQHYDTTASLSRPVLARQSHAESSILEFALYPRRQEKRIVIGPEDESSDEKMNQQVVSELYQNRMLVVLADKSVKDMAKEITAPLAISRRDGRLAHAFGGALWVESSSDGPATMEHPVAEPHEDISARMMRRAKCSRKARYSMDAALNLQMLSEEEDELGDDVDSEDTLPSIPMLIRLWSWIERIERFCNQREVYGTENKWPGKSLYDSGVWRLLQLDRPSSDDDANRDTVVYDEALSIDTYESPTRLLALSACGWAGTETLVDIQAECEASGDFERSAALAVWHGDIGAAVEALQRGADVVQSLQGIEGSGFPNFSPHYAETLQLVSMCIAGYRGADPSSSWSPVWRKACLNLLKRDDLSGENEKKIRVAYLRSMCMFLVSIGIGDGLKVVLQDEKLSIGDRVAFACRFLNEVDLQKYLDGCVSHCQESGNLEGLVVTGIEKHGLRIVQAFVDEYTDVQTASLICSRVIFAGEWERSTSKQWLDSYRALLNTWQMWQSRAMVDVDVADHISKLKARQEAELHGGRIVNIQSRRMMHPSIPAQLDARCNKCSKSLTGLRGRQDGSTPARLASKANPKPVLSCCPHCLNALPRCSICLLSLGCLNPAKKERTNLPIAEWFTWCMRCKHGGHAHHLVGWFAQHDICPVSGCDCKCQFDAMQKLHRQVKQADISENEDETSDETDENA